MFRDWELLWCPIFVVDNLDDYCVGVFYGYHSNQSHVLVGGVC